MGMVGQSNNIRRCRSRPRHREVCSRGCTEREHSGMGVIGRCVPAVRVRCCRQIVLRRVTDRGQHHRVRVGGLERHGSGVRMTERGKCSVRPVLRRHPLVSMVAGGVV